MALYKLTDGERAIFQKVEEAGNPNWFTNFYFKGDTTGTWWRPGAISERWKNGYDTLFRVWENAKRPPLFRYGERGKENVYRVVWDDGEEPTFHNHHGFIFQPWQADMHKRSQRIGVVIGGFGCGKTVGGLVSMLTWAAILPGFQGVILAPSSTQTESIYRDAITLLEGTIFAERFLLKTAEKPFPKLIVGNNHVGSYNSIRFYPIGDPRGSKKILTMNLDAALIDQAEQLDNFPEIIRNVGSRMRGQHKGRPRLGRITFIANSAINDEMWDLFDERENDPERVWGYQPHTSENPFITDEQLREITKDVGGDEEAIRVHMQGGRPIGGGEHFSQATLAKCRSKLLDEVMKKCIEENTEGYVYTKLNKIGVVEWALPPQDGRKYLVVADPGYDNPPRRNAACIMIFDYTDFPTKPAQMVGFFWVFGNNSPWPWIEKYTHLVEKYRAHFSNGIDNTGVQSLYDRVIPALQEVRVQGIPMNNNNKYGYLNLAKTMMSQGLIEFPSISRLFMQLGRYRLPDDKLAQDIVMTILLAAGWLEQLFYLKLQDESPQRRTDVSPGDRYYREKTSVVSRGDRYMRRSRKR